MKYQRRIKIFVPIPLIFNIKVLTLMFLMALSIKPSICQILNSYDSLLIKGRLNQLVLQGRLDHLFSSQDTLVMYLNLSGCSFSRFDIIKFYKNDSSIYIKPEIKITFDKEETILGQVKRYKTNQNDTLNFEYFISELQLTLPEIPDSLGEKSIFMTMGVFHKWGKKYYSERMTDEHSRFNDLYLRIMHKMYSEMEEFVTNKLEIVEDE